MLISFYNIFKKMYVNYFLIPEKNMYVLFYNNEKKMCINPFIILHYPPPSFHSGVDLVYTNLDLRFGVKHLRKGGRCNTNYCANY